MVDFKRESDESETRITREGQSRRIKPFRGGMEIEQAARKDDCGDICEGVLVNSNPKGLCRYVPDSVIARSVIFGGGHYDGSKPWEFNLGNSVAERTLLDTFNKIVGNDYWAWHKEFKLHNNTRGCSAHFHISVRGDIDLGQTYQNQMVAPARHWAIVWNNMVTLTPLLVPFFCYGETFRSSALTQWAKPICERLDAANIIDLFTRGRTVPKENRNGCIELGHTYSALSWNRHSSKKQITIENRLNETHPYWFLPVLQILSVFNNATIYRSNSIRLSDSYDKLHRCWNEIIRHKVYDALLRMDNIKFIMPRDGERKRFRGIPYLCGGNENQIYGDDKIYPTALDLFRTICRRFMNSKPNSAIKMGKVLRMWSDFINFKKVPSHLIWDIDGIYNLLYESADKKRYQDEYLYWGSSVVLEEGMRQRTNWVSSMI